MNAAARQRPDGMRKQLERSKRTELGLRVRVMEVELRKNIPGEGKADEDLIDEINTMVHGGSCVEDYHCALHYNRTSRYEPVFKRIYGVDFEGFKPLLGYDDMLELLDIRGGLLLSKHTELLQRREGRFMRGVNSLLEGLNTIGESVLTSGHDGFTVLYLLIIGRDLYPVRIPDADLTYAI